MIARFARSARNALAFVVLAAVLALELASRRIARASDRMARRREQARADRVVAALLARPVAEQVARSEARIATVAPMIWRGMKVGPIPSADGTVYHPAELVGSPELDGLD